MAFGSSGGSLWGGGSSASAVFSFAKVAAANNRAIDVTFTLAPRVVTPIGASDALNLANWSVVDVMTGVASTVLAIASVGPLTVRLTLMAPMNRAHDYVVTASPALVSAVGYAITTPRTGTIVGMAQRRAQQSRTLVDVRNPQTDAPNGGALVITSAGDYATEDGLAMLKKLVYRRLTTAVGAFYHLPGYGFGIDLSIPYPSSKLYTLKSAIEQEVRQEPEINRADATLTISPDGVLTVSIAATLVRNNQAVALQYPIQLGA
jgi:hypothetical protein